MYQPSLMNEDKLNHYSSVIKDLLKDLGIKDEEILNNTPKRWLRFLESYTLPFKDEFTDFKTFPTSSDDMVIAETHFWSICEHHLLPYFGKVYFGYIPIDKVLGISKIVRFIQFISKKPSIQEGLTQEIVDKLHKQANAQGSMVLMKGFHTCVASRYSNGWMITSAIRGLFREDKSLKEEFLKLVSNDYGSILD